ncbi:MAG TPA: type II toxin-antitoxin system mRNA interferase toxin, RelE/StbE family [Balneola sp.]|nr:type II toxin-antitoxin system mRNA interferase toxin, RelE/StbE family [Balneola sp.]HCT53618.1 type II toxin-antitoxin system mRNA interferase toxin, RelE/StbE family [Balneola sp.]|tara:strand:- start:32638 stop:32910 length:273 start_codon:yes stop_codon:yes gene_type:complete
MIWKVEFDDRARKELRKLDKQTQDRILKWLRSNLATEEDPRRTGKSLKGRMKGLWRYRVGDYRIVSQIQDEQILILVIRIGHRRDIYDKK